ncbi:YusW family protein [Enterococcus sp. AZ192]|uniref:YusW family protein n=1 Tax=unclassified Enterococcus TaxID=2608891 RepID=UPI003D27148F
MSFCAASLGTAVHSVDAATVVESNYAKTITLFNKADLLEYTGLSLTSKNVTEVYNELKKADTWEAAGYSASEASVIARDFGLYYSKSINLLKKMTYQDDLHLKVILITKGYVKAEFGLQSYYVGETPETPEVPETPEEPETPETPEAPEQSDLKKLEIEVDYKNGQEVELQYEVKSNGTVKAQYQDKSKKIQLQGSAAQTKIEGIIAGLDLKTASQKEVTTHILNKLGNGSNYKQFQFQGQFNDNTKVKFKLK